MSKQVKSHNGKENIVRTADQTFAYVRPKYFVGSSGSVWEGETIDLRAKEPDQFDIPNGTNYSNNFRTLCHTLRSKAIHFISATIEDDVANVTCAGNCTFKDYESNVGPI
jgi:hypothetical protein